MTETTLNSSTDSIDKPQLSVLSVDTPPSSSPFPSPSSSFIPPPRPGAHEFALRPPPQTTATATKKQHHQQQPLQTQMAANTKQPEQRQQQEPATEAYASRLDEDQSKGIDDTKDLGGVAPKEYKLAEHQTISIPSLPNSSPATPTKLSVASSYSPQIMNSPTTPTSSRPAPASPASSRRASRAVSTASSSPSSPGGATLSRNNSSARKPKRASKLSMTFSPSQLEDIGDGVVVPPGGQRGSKIGSGTRTTSIGGKSGIISKSSASSSSNYIGIVDFAFPVGDPRRLGQGSDVPKPNRIRKLNKKLGAVFRERRKRQSGVSSAGSELSTDTDSDDDDDDGESREDAMKALEDEVRGGFKWGIGRLSWGFGFRSSQSSASQSGPTRNDFDRNFVGEDEDNSSQDDDQDVDEDEDDPPLVPGLYRALYAFVPEGTAEMALSEDQLVKVLGRGGGVGWAVVVVDDDNEQDAIAGARHQLNGSADGAAKKRNALVPESYLELVEADE